MQSFFLKEKPVRILVGIYRSRDEVYCRVLSTEADTTYAHTVNIVSRLEEAKLVVSRKEGRKKVLEPTERGKKYGEMFNKLINELEKDYQR